MSPDPTQARANELKFLRLVEQMPRGADYSMLLIMDQLINEKGVNPNATNDQGEDALDLLWKKGDAYSMRVTQSLQKLLENGFDPLARGWFGKAEEWMLNKIIKVTGRLEIQEKKQFRDSQGGSFVHHLAEHHRGKLGQLIALNEEGRTELTEIYLSERMVNHQRIDGATPLHLFWDLKERLIEEVDEVDQWMITQYLCMTVGGDLGLEDHQGRAVIDLISGALDQNLVNKPANLSPEFAALLERTRLERGTGPAPAIEGRHRTTRL